MKHLYTLPICSNALFIYKLDIKDNLILKFKKEKFKPVEHGTVLISKDMNVLKKYNNLNKEIKKSVNKTLKEILMLNNINYKIFSSWLTKTEPKAFSESHSHTNSWLSGVYYPKGNPSFKIKFYNRAIFKINFIMIIKVNFLLRQQSTTYIILMSGLYLHKMII